MWGSRLLLDACVTEPCHPRPYPSRAFSHAAAPNSASTATSCPCRCFCSSYSSSLDRNCCIHGVKACWRSSRIQVLLPENLGYTSAATRGGGFCGGDGSIRIGCREGGYKGRGCPAIAVIMRAPAAPSVVLGKMASSRALPAIPLRVALPASLRQAGFAPVVRMSAA
jgi:hypothetical protein